LDGDAALALAVAVDDGLPAFAAAALAGRVVVDLTDTASSSSSLSDSSSSDDETTIACFGFATAVAGLPAAAFTAAVALAGRVLLVAVDAGCFLAATGGTSSSSSLSLSSSSDDDSTGLVAAFATERSIHIANRCKKTDQINISYK
jgi:hypothetical protein